MIINGKKEKTYLDINVYEAANQRLEFIFDHFKKVYFSVSFGKDSSVMMHLALDIARRKNKLPLNILFIDLEGQYKITIEHAKEMINQDGVRCWWVCLPINLRNSVSVFQPYWTCWDPDLKGKWIREMPDLDCVIKDVDYFPFFQPRIEFEDFVVKFGMWFAKGEDTACNVGIRTQESLHRYCAVFKDKEENKFMGKNWTTKIRKNVFNCYPIYDWTVEDIWTSIGKFDWNYNKLYDFMFIAGMNLHDMRICQPYGDDQRKGLDLFKKVEPETWAKVVDRVAGANFGNIYCKSQLLGHRKAELPGGYTWKSYTDFLLETIPKFMKMWYLEKIKSFEAWWAERGYPFEKWFDATPLKSHPDYKQFKKLPSWERIAKTILRNDILCKNLSYGQTPLAWTKYQRMKAIYGF